MNFRLSVLDRYIGKEVLTSWLVVLLVLQLIVMSMNTVKFLSWLAEGYITTSVFYPLLINGFVDVLILLIPLSLLLGVLLAFGRLYKDSEMTAIMASGHTPASWYRPLLIVVVPVCLMLLWLVLTIMPDISEQREKIIAQSKNEQEKGVVFAGRFNETRNGQSVLFPETVSNENKTMGNVFHRQIVEGETHIDISSHAKRETNKNADEYMVMRDGVHYAGKPGRADYRIIEFEEYGVLIKSVNKIGARKRSKSIPTRDLWTSERPADKAELQWRFSVPLAALIIAVLALPFSHTTPRSGRYAKLALAVLIYLIYSNMLGVAKTWTAREIIPVWVGLWWVHAIALAVVAFFVIRAGHYQFKKHATK